MSLHKPKAATASRQTPGQLHCYHTRTTSKPFIPILPSSLLHPKLPLTFTPPHLTFWTMASLMDHPARGETIGYSFSQPTAAPAKQHGFYPYEETDSGLMLSPANEDGSGTPTMAARLWASQALISQSSLATPAQHRATISTLAWSQKSS